MVSKTQVLPSIVTIIKEAKDLYNQDVFITSVDTLPDTQNIPIINSKAWIKIKDVICVFVDMKGSTRMSASKYSKSTAKAYQLYTGTAVKIFHEFEAPYIDVRGDGVLALFNYNNAHRALAAAVTFKTFANDTFKPLVNKNYNLDIGSHIGIDMKTLLVRKIGLKQHNKRSDRQNEVWAGRPVNMAAKLASQSEDNQLLVSDRFFAGINDECAIMSCGCPDGQKSDLWDDFDLTENDNFDFNTAYALSTNWCSIHGLDSCLALLDADK